MRATNNIVELRQLLAERFPHLRQGVAVPAAVETRSSGVPALDAVLGGGLPRGEFTEIVAEGDGSGSAQVIHACLRQAAADGQFLVLVDGADSFDVTAVDPDILARLLWVRCTDASEAFKATDLLLRDRNFPLVILDLKLNPAGQLRKISGSVWHRYGRLIEQNRATVLVVTPFQFVSGAACRVRLESRLGLDALSKSPGSLIDELRFTLLRSATASGHEPAVQAG